MTNFTLFLLVLCALIAAIIILFCLANSKKELSRTDLISPKHDARLLNLAGESLECLGRGQLRELLDYAWEKSEQESEAAHAPWRELYRRTWLALYGYAL